MYIFYLICFDCSFGVGNLTTFQISIPKGFTSEMIEISKVVSESPCQK